jgi:hypothetical protein
LQSHFVQLLPQGGELTHRSLGLALSIFGKSMGVGGLLPDGFINAFHFVQLPPEYPPSKSREEGGQEQQKYGGYIKRARYFVYFLGLIALAFVSVAKGFDRGGNLGGMLIILGFLPFCVGMYCLIYGFFDLSFP